MKQVLFNLLLAFFISWGVANAATNTLHDKPLKTVPASADETYVWDTGTSTLKKTTFAPFLVGDCTGFPCLDGTSDGGNYIKLWAGTGSYWTALQGGSPAANRSWRLPIAAPPAAGATYIMNMDEYGQMGFVDPDTLGGGATVINDLTDVDTTGKATGKILKFDSSGNLVVGDDATGSGSAPSGTVNGQVLIWATDQWVASTAPWLTTTLFSTEQDWTAVQNFNSGLTATGMAITISARSDIKFGTDSWLDDTKGNGDTNYLWSADKIFDQLAGKQATLVSGTNIKTVNSQDITGGGNITIDGSAPTVQSADPTAASADGWYAATGSGDIFYKSSAGLFTIAGSYAADPATQSLTITPVGFTGADKFTYSASDYTTEQVFSELSADASFTVTPDTGRAITCIGTGLTDNTGGSYTANTDTANVTAACTSSVTATGYTDGFERDNESPITTPWTISSGFDSAFRIVSYGAMGTDAGVEAVAVYTSGTFANNQYSEVKVPATFTDLMGAVVRSGTSFKQGYVFRRMSADTVQLGGWNNNEWIGSIGSCSSADFTGGATMRIEVTGSSIVGKVDGTTVCTATDTVLTTGKPGIYTKDSTVAIDDWAGGDL